MKTTNGAFLISSAIGMFVYIKNASLSWNIPQEEGLDPAMDGVAIVWGVGALPILLLFIFLNIIWWGIVLKRGLDKKPVAFCALAWAIAVTVDFYHH